MKLPENVKSQKLRAIELLVSTMLQVPIVKDITIQERPRIDSHEFDFLATVAVGNESHRLLCAVKSRLQPRHARMAALQLTHTLGRLDIEAAGVLISPYLSPASRLICEEHGIGFLDLEGNARIAFNGVFVEREVPNKPAAERKRLKSLFKPKSARVLKAILADPARTWRVTELAEESGVSIGHISNIRRALLDREIGCINQDGFFLRDPDQLLDEWLAAYEKPAGTRVEFYTTVHGERMENTLQGLMKDSPDRPDLVLASFSAAQWLAPYARHSDIMLYADAYGMARLEDALGLVGSSSGGNVHVVVLDDRDILDESVRLASGQICTSPVQTYLDLATQGERGKEAADFLRSRLLKWHMDDSDDPIRVCHQ